MCDRDSGRGSNADNVLAECAAAGAFGSRTILSVFLDPNASQDPRFYLYRDMNMPPEDHVT